VEIIAEIGQNHNGDMDLARRLIVEAKRAGADVAKFQLFDARSLFPKQGNPWFEYNCKTELMPSQVEMLAAECVRAGIEFMASVFDTKRIAWLEAVGVKRYKIASRSVRDRALIEAVAATGKPLIVSLGMWAEPEFPKISTPATVDYLYCISQYPTPLTELHLARVDFAKYGGFSDHTVGVDASLAAMARGARIVEKHFTLDRDMYGPDHAGSVTPQQLAVMCAFRDSLEQML
jgi:N-acetylneuraminate synthase/N,N'-diacetyllegionaminate synthase